MATTMITRSPADAAAHVVARAEAMLRSPRRRREPWTACPDCVGCARRRADGPAGRLLVGQILSVSIGAGVLVLHLLTFGMLQAQVARCPACAHRAFQHRLQRSRPVRGRDAGSPDDAETVLFPVYPPSGPGMDDGTPRDH